MLKNFLLLLFYLFFPLFIGFAASSLSAQSAIIYDEFIRPPFSPPSYVFGIVWTCVYLLMGLAAFLVSISNKARVNKEPALQVFFFQLAINFCWTFFFYTMEYRLFAFLWILFLWVLIFYTIKLFYKISKTAAILLLPYIFWLSFAAYLNLGIYILNR